MNYSHTMSLSTPDDAGPKISDLRDILATYTNIILVITIIICTIGIAPLVVDLVARARLRQTLTIFPDKLSILDDEQLPESDSSDIDRAMLRESLMSRHSLVSLKSAISVKSAVSNE